MLSRIADNLFWAGRYIERSENLARHYLTLHFNAVESGTKALQVQSYNSVYLLAGMSDIPSVDYIHANEKDVINRLLFDISDPNTLKASIHKARENVRSARDVVNTSLWEAVNKMYIRINTFDNTFFEQQDVSNLCESILRDTLIIKSIIDNSLIHNETWAFIKFGLHIECALQTAGMISIKLAENDIYSETMNLDNTETYFSLNLLKNTDSYDMYKNHYKTLPNLSKSVEFLVFNTNYPRSVAYNMDKIRTISNKLSKTENIKKSTLEHILGKINATLKFTDIEEIEENYKGFIDKVILDIYTISTKIEEKYFIY